ncbi:uncharacterized protein LOC143449740 [Clavelina lepadiformis]|uniref:uncharacterized protein LOC143449740 n=1 Tax=Clavelina lepadiformis TaxID=159417 RepID=UPI0040416C01
MKIWKFSLKSRGVEVKFCCAGKQPVCTATRGTSRALEPEPGACSAFVKDYSSPGVQSHFGETSRVCSCHTLECGSAFDDWEEQPCLAQKLHMSDFWTSMMTSLLPINVT